VLLSASIAKVFRYEKISISSRAYELLLDIIPPEDGYNGLTTTIFMKPDLCSMAAQTRGAGQPSLQKLKFHDKLVGKGLSTDVLLKKLKNLHTQLAELDQDRVDTALLATVRKELTHNTILLHKDRGVKAHAACCLADILRLFAPDAPYTHNELRDIFRFFFRQLSTGLRGSEFPYYNEYFHLLGSLSTVKSVVLVCDLPNSEELMVDIFRDFFALVRHDLSKKIELHMADILVALIDEATSLPSELMDIIMAQILDKNVVCKYPIPFSARRHSFARYHSSFYP
jgi:sister-chromatid-cohesion protein PDS5